MTLLIFFSVGCSKSANKIIDPPNSYCSTQTIEKEYLVTNLEGKVHLVKGDREQMLVLAQDLSISRVEPNYRVVHTEFLDDFFPSNTKNDWDSIGAQNYWDQGFYGQGSIVAVVDGGVKVNSPFLSDRIKVNIQESGSFQNDGIDNDGNGFIDDDKGWNFVTNQPELADENGHGTKMAQLIAGNSSSPVGPGIAPKAKIIPVDFMNQYGGDVYGAIQAIEYSIQQGAKIINNSWMASCSQILNNKYANWEKQGVLLIHAAGNDGVNLDRLPVNSSNYYGFSFLTVGSIDQHDSRAEFSNFGSNVLLYAPGINIWASEWNGNFINQSTVQVSGTSSSTAIVSGAAALIWSRHPNWNSVTVRNFLLKSSFRSQRSGLSILNLD